MSGVWWAVVAGLGFGLFQTLNRRAVRGMDVFLATFLQLFVSALVLSGASLATEDLSLLRAASAGTLLNFALAGLIHFFVGWTFLNASQKRIGAARTSPLIGTTPLFAALIAALTLREFPTWLAGIGIVLIVGGVYVISNERGGPHSGPQVSGWRASLLGLSAAFCWALSPIFIRLGLKDLPSPLLGVTVGLIASVVAYGLALLWQRGFSLGAAVSRDALVSKIVAAVLVGLSTWARWIALDLAPVAEVLAISLLSVPVVILLSPLVVDRHLERASARVWLGAGLVVGGVLLLIFYQS